LNPSIRESVTLAGTLKGQNMELPCTIEAVKVSLPKLDIWEYVKADVAEAPSTLPDGEYELFFEGRRMKAMKRAGCWVSDVR
jgi:hypothetical protein